MNEVEILNCCYVSIHVASVIKIMQLRSLHPSVDRIGEKPAKG